MNIKTVIATVGNMLSQNITTYTAYEFVTVPPVFLACPCVKSRSKYGIWTRSTTVHLQPPPVGIGLKIIQVIHSNLRTYNVSCYLKLNIHNYVHEYLKTNHTLLQFRKEYPLKRNELLKMLPLKNCLALLLTMGT